jgi:small subunit ribosomal protein S6
VLEELTSAFRFNDAVIRNMVINRKEAVTDASLLAKRPDEKRERSSRDEAGTDTDDEASQSGDDKPDEREAEANADA